MNWTVLQRTRFYTLLTALVLSVPLGFLVSWSFAGGVVATAAWAVAGFWVLERILKAAVVPPGEPRNVFVIVLWGVAKLTVYALAVWVLLVRPFPALSHFVGLTLLLVLLVTQGAVVHPRRNHADHEPVRRGDHG